MKKIFLSKKSTFKCYSKTIQIYDKNKNIFYFFERANSRPFFFFNLPKGSYFVIGVVRKMRNFMQQSIKLPKKQRKIPFSRYKIRYENNPNKATIFYGRKLIIFDYSLRELPSWVRDFIILHEYGHHFYKSEMGADLFAFNEMLKRGFNFSQICVIPIKILSNQKRVNNVIRYLRKNNFGYKNKLKKWA